MIAMNNDEFCKIDEICKMFQISRITAYRWIKSGKISGYKIGKSYLFKKSDITNLINGSKVSNEQ